METTKTGENRRGPGELVTFVSCTPNSHKMKGGEVTASLADQYNQWAKEHPRAQILNEMASINISTAGIVQQLVVRYYEPPPPAHDEIADIVGDEKVFSIKRTVRVVEEILIRRALAHTNRNRTRAAELLEISHRALLFKIKEFGIT